MIKIYLPNTPSRFIGKAQILKVKKVKMTCGGGIGGCSWDEYIVDFPETPKHDLIKVADYKGNKMTLNTRYVVKVTDSQIVMITTDSQNPNYYGVKRFYYETPCNEAIMLCNEYGNSEKHGVKFLECINL